MSNEHNPSRRDFLKTAGAALAAAALPGTVSAADEAPSNVVDVRKDALLVPKAPVKDQDYFLFNFETEKLPDVKKVELNLRAEQVYQLASIGDKDGKLQAIVLPKQDGKMKILQLREGQEVQLKVFMGKDAADAVLETGGALGKHLKQGEVPGWVKPITDALEAKDATKGAKNSLVDPYYKELVGQFDESKKQKKVGAEFKDSGMYLDSHIQAQLAANKTLQPK